MSHTTSIRLGLLGILFALGLVVVTCVQAQQAVRTQGPRIGGLFYYRGCVMVTVADKTLEGKWMARLFAFVETPRGNVGPYTGDNIPLACFAPEVDGQVVGLEFADETIKGTFHLRGYTAKGDILTHFANGVWVWIATPLNPAEDTVWEPTK